MNGRKSLILAGHAYVDDQSQADIRSRRGTLTEPGQNSPFRERSVEENLDLFRRMKAGEFPNGARVLRAKIDMAVRQHQPARPRSVSHPARHPSAHRQSMVDLSKLRLCPWPVGCDRGHHPFDLHAGIRGSPAAV